MINHKARLQSLESKLSKKNNGIDILTFVIIGKNQAGEQYPMSYQITFIGKGTVKMTPEQYNEWKETEIIPNGCTLVEIKI